MAISAFLTLALTQMPKYLTSKKLLHFCIIFSIIDRETPNK